jgi:hypothetical protein
MTEHSAAKSPKPPQSVIDALEAVEVDPAELARAVEEGRELRREFEKTIDKIRWRADADR